MNNKNLNESILGWIELGLLTAQLAMGLGHIKFSVKNFLSDRKKRKQIEQLILKLNKTNPELVQKLKTLKPSEPVPSDISSEIKSSLSPEELQLFDTIQESKTNMDQTTQLRQLIRESIQEYIREVETSGNIAAQEAKIRACEEAIALRERKVALEGIDETMYEMIDQSKINLIKKEIKDLQKYLAKATKTLEKMRDKAEGKTAKPKSEEETTDEGIIDEVSIDNDSDEAGPQLEEGKKMTAAQKAKKEKIVKGMKRSKSFSKSKEGKSEMYATATSLAIKENKQFLHMQKLAGLITETQYKEKMQMLNEAGMNLPWVAKEPESWGGKPDKDSKWFVHGDFETAKTKEETPIEFIDFEDNRPEYDSVFVGTNMPSELSKNANFNKGKTTIGATIDDKGVPTGKYWIVGMSTSDSDSLIRKVKDWTPLNNYIKDKLAK